ncbi:MAG: peptidoglycan DD-metalloendopeptidase family protein [Candidatus Limnocylindria bacterium]
MAKIAFRSPVTVPLLRFGTPKPLPPDPRAFETFRVTKRSRDPDPGGPGGKHLAVDIGNFRCGDPIVAMAPGKAHRAHDEAKADGAPSNALGIRIDHGSGVVTEYWHFDAFLVRDVATVSAGDPIGVVGTTGNVDGCHCHIELKVKTARQDPEPFLFGKTLTVPRRASTAAAPGGGAMPLVFKATSYRPLTNRRYVTDIKANFRAAPNTGSRIIKQFPGNTPVIPSGVVTGQAIQGGSPRQGFVPTDWLEARMKVGTNVELGYFHSSVLTGESHIE